MFRCWRRVLSQRPFGSVPLRNRLGRRSVLRGYLERLEARPLMATITGGGGGGGGGTGTVNWVWTGDGGDGLWDDGANWTAIPGADWSGGQTNTYPGQTTNLGENDVVTIDTGSQAETVVIQSFDALSVASLTTTVNDTLTIDGVLTIGGSSTLAGPFSLDEAILTASGAGVTVDVSGAATAAASSLYAIEGATLSLPGLTSFDSGVLGSLTFSANGTGSTLDLSALTTLSCQGAPLSISAQQGGSIDLAALTVDTSTPGVSLDSEGTGSQVTLANLNALDQGSITVADGGALPLGQLVSLTNSSLLDSGETFDLTALTNVDGSSVTAENGAVVSIPNVTSYVDSTMYGTSFTASTGGELNLPQLASVQVSNSTLALDATGGALLAPALAMVTQTGSGTVTISATGQAGHVDLAALAGLNQGHGVVTLGDGGCSVALATGTLSLPSGDTGTISLYPLPQGLTLNLDMVESWTDTTFDVAPNTTVGVTTATLTGNTTFAMGQGASIVFGGGIFSGDWTGEGPGTVQLGGGKSRFTVAAGGLALNFPAPMFQWTGGLLDGALGDVTNLGTINLSGAGDKILGNYGTLDNYGTIIQTGTGNLGLASLGAAYTTLKIEPGGAYLLESDSGIDLWDGGTTAVVNAGTIRKTAGTGLSDLVVQGPIDNSGTIEADSGTLQLDGSISQLTGGILTGGAWIASNGAALALPNGSYVSTSQASVSLSGAGATITGLSDLNANNGTFSVTAGASFRTFGSLTNSGSLTVGAGSVLTVSGDYTQTSTGAFDTQLGGAPASGQFGLLAVSGMANLDGAFGAALVDGYSPSVGHDFAVLTYAGVTGEFLSVTGLGPFFTERLGASSLDLIDSTTNAVDLVASSITAPSAAAPGGPITVSWQVDNVTASAAAGNWQDSVYLSTTPSITPSAVLLGATEHKGGLGADASYNAWWTGSLPALTPAHYYVLVQVDSLYQVPDPDRGNDVLATPTPLAVAVPALTLGTPFGDAFTAPGQGRYYQITVSAGSSLLVSLSDSPGTEQNAIYVSVGAVPTPYNAEYETSSAAGADPSLAVPTTEAGTYYVLVQNQSGTPGAFNVTASTPGLSLVQASPNAVGNAGRATLTIHGLDLGGDTTYTLVGPGGTVAAAAVDRVDSSLAYVTFNFTDVPPGAYQLDAENGDGSSANLPAAVQVTPGGGADVVAKLVSDSPVRVNRMSVFYVDYTNVGNNDAPAPLLTISSPDYIPMTLDSTDTSPSALSLKVLAVNQNGPAAVLPPGATFQFAVYFRPTAAGGFTFNVAVTSASDRTDAFAAEGWQDNVLAAVPSDVTAAASWPAVDAQLQQMVGATWGQYVGLLDHYAALLPETRGAVSNPTDVLQLAIAQATAAVGTSISGVATATTSDVLLAGDTITATNTTTGDTFTATILNDGSFVFPSVTPGSYTFSATDDLIDGSTSPVTVNAGQAVTGVTVVLDPEVLITGQVTSAATGLPVAGAVVAVMAGNGLEAVATTNANGDYSTVFPPGSYAFVVDAPGLAREYSADAPFAAGLTTLNFALAPESAATGTVKLTDGQAVPSIDVLATLDGTEPLPYFYGAFTGPTFDLGSLAPGVYSFTVSVPNYVPVTVDNVAVGPGATVNLNLIQLTPEDPVISNALVAAKDYLQAAVTAFFALRHPGSSAQLALDEYFNGPGVGTLTGGLGVSTLTPSQTTNPVVYLTGSDLQSLQNSATTQNALQQTINFIGTKIKDAPQVQAAIQTIKDEGCDAQPQTVTIPLPVLVGELGQGQNGIGPWIDVTTDTYGESPYGPSPENVLKMWEFGDAGIGSQIVGGVGWGGPPPANAPATDDDRVLTGSVTVVIATDGQATLTGNFGVKVDDTFDFDPGGLGEIGKDTQAYLTGETAVANALANPNLGPGNTVLAYGASIANGLLYASSVPGDLAVAGGVLSLGGLESADLACDVPIRAQFNGPAVSTDLKFDTGMPDCGNGPGPKASTNGVVVVSHDPNALVGPAGFGPQNFIPPTGVLPYTVDFENDGAAAAQVVTVTESLDPSLDGSTFQLGSFGWGPVNVTVPAGLMQYQTTVRYQNADGTSLNVLVSLDLNVASGQLTATFTSLDPSTGKAPTGALDGFLYPEDGTGVGQGYVSYTVQPKAGLSTGTVIDQQASVVFDTNDPLVTDAAVNTIDSGAPTSSVSALPAVELTPSFTVSWSGQDDAGGSGIASYSIDVSDNGGPFTPWLTGTTLTSASYSGQVGHTYRFYSVATDNVGNTETTPAGAEAATVDLQATTLSDVSATGTYGATATLSATLTGPGNAPLGGETVAFTINGNGVGSTTTNGNGVATLTGVSLGDMSAGTYADAVSAAFAENSPYAAGTARGDLTVSPALPVVSVDTVHLTPGTALADAQLAGSAAWVVGGRSVTVPGQFSFGALAGTVLPPGSATEPVTFTPSDSTDYSPVNTTVTVVVQNVAAANIGLLLLDPTGSGALAMSGSAQVTVSPSNGGGLVVDSTSPSAVQLSGGVKVNTAELDLSGPSGLSETVAAAVRGVVKTDVAVTADPLASLPPPAPTPAYALASRTWGNLAKYQPGTYPHGITISGNTVAVLAPGVYDLTGGGFNISGSARVVGLGAVIYLGPHASGGVRLSDSASLTLLSPAAGPYQGVGLFADAAVTTFSINGRAVLNTLATIDVPGARVQLGGNAVLNGLGAEVIARDLSLSGAASLTVVAGATRGRSAGLPTIPPLSPASGAQALVDAALAALDQQWIVVDGAVRKVPEPFYESLMFKAFLAGTLRPGVK